MTTGVARLALLCGDFRRSEAGATAIEYGLIAALIGVSLIGVLTIVGVDLTQVFADVAYSLRSRLRYF